MSVESSDSDHARARWSRTWLSVATTTLQLADAGVELDVVERHDVGRVGGRDRQAAVLALEDEHAAALGDRPGQQPDGVGDDEGAAEVDERQRQRDRQRLGDLALGGEAARDDDLAEAQPGLALLDVLLRRRAPPSAGRR